MELKIKEMIKTDKFISENIIPFKDAFNKPTNPANTFYNLLVELLFDSKYTKYGPEKTRFHDVKLKSIEHVEKINLIYDFIPKMIL